MKIAIIGQGYVGLPLAMAATEAGYEVIGFDKNADLVDNLNSGSSHVEDVLDSSLKKQLATKSYLASSNPPDLIGSEIVIIAVPTPLNGDREPDLSYVISAANTIGANLNSPALIINESTSHPGTLRNVIAIEVAKSSSSEIKHFFAVSPERVDPGNKFWNVKKTPRILAGLTPEATELARNFYSSFCDELVEVSVPEVAETAKLFENTFRQVNIALVNELALITRSIGISVNEVIEAAATKPYGFMKFNPGIGVGGHCIPVDPSYLAFTAKEAGIEPRFIELANQVNLQMPREITNRIKKENGASLKGKKVLVCGLSYKPNIADVRESPSITLIGELKKEGAIVFWHDPLVKDWGGSFTVEPVEGAFEITVVALLHDAMDSNKILKSAKYVFDCTGKTSASNKL
jgi:UDP-N-acetyl-D-glucosamine dehydrogenase